MAGSQNFSPARLALLKRVAALSHSGRSIHAQERRMHVSHARLLDLRHQAKQAGFSVKAVVNRQAVGESKAWARVDNAIGTCGRCGLRGEHICVGAIDPLAGARAGHVYPEGI